MKIAVTGARGLVGTAVVELALRQGHSVVAIDRPEAAEAGPAHERRVDVSCDVTSYGDLDRAVDGCTAIVHLAAIPSPGGRPDYVVHNNNVLASYNALSVAAAHGIDKISIASSINAIGGIYSREARYDYFPVDERHPTYNEDPYSLSKWICERQADSFARRYESMTISTIRLHQVVREPRIYSSGSDRLDRESKQLWGYTSIDATARAFLQALDAGYHGHETFYIVGDRTTTDVPSQELAAKYFPDVPITGDLSGNRGFFDCAKARRLLDWNHG